MRRLLGLGLLVAVPAVGMTAQDAYKADASRMQTKLVSIIDRGIERPGRKPKPQMTAFTDREVNAYFRVYGPAIFPVGVKDAQVTIEPAGKVQARAMVALDEALKTKQRSWMDPLAWVTGSLEVTAAGTVTGTNGQGRFSLEQAAVGGVPVPKAVLQQLVSYYTATPIHPNGFEMDEPFTLPARIHSVQTSRGTATIVQR
jgi:hypothetical protein